MDTRQESRDGGVGVWLRFRCHHLARTKTQRIPALLALQRLGACLRHSSQHHALASRKQRTRRAPSTQA